MRDKLDLVEEKLDSFSKTEKIALSVFIPLLVFTLFYFLYITNAFDQRESNERTLTKLNHNLGNHSKKFVVHKIQVVKQQLLYVKSAIVESKQKLRYLEASLIKSNFSFLSQKDFTYFLNDLLTKSVENNFLIDTINMEKDNRAFVGRLKYKKTVIVQGSGEFLNTLKFIREVEKNSMLMEIKNLNIETNGTTPHVTYEIKFYGVKQ